MKIKICVLLLITFFFNRCNLNKTEPEVIFPEIPGIVVTHEPASSGVFVGAPSILVIPNGDYMVSLNYTQVRLGDRGDVHRTSVFTSTDKGETWELISEINPQRWSTIFYHLGDLYLIGADRAFENAIIRKSTDDGKTWTEVIDENTGLLAEDGFHCAPVPVVFHKGRIWRAYERQVEVDGRRKRKALMISAPEDADLLKRSSWTFSNELLFDDNWHEDIHDWIEGNAVVDPYGNIVNIIRVQRQSGSGPDNLAALIQVSDDGKLVSFDPEEGIIVFPGGSKKFSIRFDPVSQKYWSLTNWIQPKDEIYLDTRRAGQIRNTLALISSEDLKRWTIERVVLHHPDVFYHAFQYVDWLIEGDHIIAVSRTAFDDGIGGAHNYHDANFVTFHRIKNFRGNYNK